MTEKNEDTTSAPTTLAKRLPDESRWTHAYLPANRVRGPVGNPSAPDPTDEEVRAWPWWRRLAPGEQLPASLREVWLLDYKPKQKSEQARR